MRLRWPIGMILCGVSAPVLAFDEIINGEESSSTSDYPSAGGMLAGTIIDFGGTTYDIKMLMCSSTLIAPDVVLLAAHCIDFSYYEQMAGMSFDDANIGFSRTADLSAWSGMPGTEWPEDTILAWEALAHPGFSMAGMGIGLSENDDIALLFLEEAILDVEPALLPTSAEAAQITEGTSVDIVGWGQQTSDQNPPAGTVGYKMHGTSHIAETAETEFKVGEVESDVRKCHGDSGGPTYLDVGDGDRVIGVTSHSYDMTDCRETGGVDTRVDHYLDWIDDEMRARCEDGTRVWCETDGIIDPDWIAPDDVGDFDGDTKITGCGCSSSKSATGWVWLLGLLGVFGVRRRR
jgi:MYXO-CTERM domain-containing protein